MKQTISIDGTPSTHLLESQLSTKVSYPEGLSELVDNALDQDAKTISIKLGGESITVTDDGNGCDSLEAMIRLGGHKRTKTTKLGRFGVGLKNVSAGLGELLDINTVKDGVERKLSVHWPTYNASNDWKLQGTEEDTRRKNGTEIVISQLHSFRPQYSPIRSALGFTFAPAIWNGRKICIKFKSREHFVDAWKIPRMQDVIEDSCQNGDIGFTVKAGIVDTTNDGPFVLACEHRIIGSTTEPLGEYSTGGRFLAYVELLGKWPMLKHKDGLRDSTEAEWLYRELNEICKPLLEKVHDIGESVELIKMQAELEAIFSGGGTIGKAKRPNKGDNTSTIEPVNTPRKVSEAEEVDANQYDCVRQRSGSRRKKGFTIRYQDLSPSTDIGSVDINSKRVLIVLNQEHPYILNCKKSNDAFGLRSASLALLSAQQHNADSTQAIFKFERDSGLGRFVEFYSYAMREIAKQKQEEV